MGDGPARVVPVRLDDTLFAAENWAYASDPDDDMPAKQFVLGFDTSGRLLELSILTSRRRYLHLLE